MALNLTANAVISADAKGVIEYWDVDTFQMPKTPKISFEYKTETGQCVEAMKWSGVGWGGMEWSGEECVI
jgi:hypothetical protein